MKIAKVVFKTGDQCLFTNYRPIFYYRNEKNQEQLCNARFEHFPNWYDCFAHASMGLDLICQSLKLFYNCLKTLLIL